MSRRQPRSSGDVSSCPLPAQPLRERFGEIGHTTERKKDSDQMGPAGATASSSSAAAGTHRGSAAGDKCIRSVSSFHELYDLGKEVMPSTHSYMKVNFAHRKKDGHAFVVKTRFKPNCFRSREDERSWRQNTEFLLNMPDCSGVAKLHDVVEDPKAFYVVMEKASGMDLFETFEHDGIVPVPVLCDILRQLLTSLVHIHSHNAVHKDLKLENVMLDQQRGKGDPAPPQKNVVKVIDFDTLEEWAHSNPPAKDVVGTDQYISQEAYAGRYSPLSDIFAIGVVAYKLLCGRFPFHDGMFDDEAGENWVGSTKMQQIRRRLRAAKVDFSHTVFRDNPEACDLVTRMLAYSDVQRPSARAALQHPFLAGTGTCGTTASSGAAGGDSAAVGCVPEVWSDELVDDGIIISD